MNNCVERKLSKTCNFLVLESSVVHLTPAHFLVVVINDHIEDPSHPDNLNQTEAPKEENSKFMVVLQLMR